MNKLMTQLQRLYFLDGQRWSGEGVLTRQIVERCVAGEIAVAFDLVGADGMARTLVVEFEHGGDWQHAARLYQAVQDDLGLPAPALSVSGEQGYSLWFSLAEAILVEEAGAFLAALRSAYLADLKVNRLGLYPAADAPARMTLVPGSLPASGKWSAFIDPTLGGMFIDEPWLDMAPSQDKQADLLAAIKSIKAAEFDEALLVLQRAAQTDPAPPAHVSPAQVLPGDAAVGQACRARRSTLCIGSGYSDPQSFLLAVMNDPSASARQRIAAAKALLPYFPAGAARKP